MQKLIVLAGPQNCGKSDTVIRACKSFLHESGVTKIVCDSNDDAEERDIICTVKINGVDVGFSSGGDSRKAVENGLEQLKECEIIVCATRSKADRNDNGGAKKCVDDYMEENEIKCHWLNQAKLGAGCDASHSGEDIWASLDQCYGMVNQTIADLILSLIKIELNFLESGQDA